ncbi:nitroreductase [Dongia sp.]|uniref:nitroreductase family protein n=1 Tax=Dongia sp. TaxID=1977262 RepID=UPI0035B13274
MEALLARHSVAVKRLGAPGPSAAELLSIYEAATTAPDHGALRPWRLIEIGNEARPQLAQLFIDGKRRSQSELSAAEIEREREKAVRPPVLLAFVARPIANHPTVPAVEQLASAGAAMQLVLVAAHFLGYGAIILSGARCADRNVMASLQIGEDEIFLGFISIGSIVDEPRFGKRPEIHQVVSKMERLKIELREEATVV